MIFGKARSLSSLTLDYTWVLPGRPGWVLRGSKNRNFDSDGLAEFVLKFFLDEAPRATDEFQEDD
jgi:hypothetical protein